MENLLFFLAAYFIGGLMGYRVGFARKRDKVLKTVSRQMIQRYSHEAAHEHISKSDLGR